MLIPQVMLPIDLLKIFEEERSHLVGSATGHASVVAGTPKGSTNLFDSITGHRHSRVDADEGKSSLVGSSTGHATSSR